MNAGPPDLKLDAGPAASLSGLMAAPAPKQEAPRVDFAALVRSLQPPSTSPELDPSPALDSAPSPTSEPDPARLAANDPAPVPAPRLQIAASPLPNPPLLAPGSWLLLTEPGLSADPEAGETETSEAPDLSDETDTSDAVDTPLLAAAAAVAAALPAPSPAPAPAGQNARCPADLAGSAPTRTTETPPRASKGPGPQNPVAASETPATVQPGAAANLGGTTTPIAPPAAPNPAPELPPTTSGSGAPAPAPAPSLALASGLATIEDLRPGLTEASGVAGAELAMPDQPRTGQMRVETAAPSRDLPGIQYLRAQLGSTDSEGLAAQPMPTLAEVQAPGLTVARPAPAVPALADTPIAPGTEAGLRAAVAGNPALGSADPATTVGAGECVTAAELALASGLSDAGRPGPAQTPVRPAGGAAARGTAVAEALHRMKTTSKEEQTVPWMAKELPVTGTIDATAEAAVRPSLTRLHLDRHGVLSLEIKAWEWMNSRPAAATIETSPDDPIAVQNVGAVDHVERLISREVTAIRQLKADSLTVVLKPDAGTEMVLQLQQKDGHVEAFVRCDTAAFERFQRDWPQLQESLASLNVKLLPLKENPSTSYQQQSSRNPFEGMADPGTSQQQPRQEQSRDREPALVFAEPEVTRTQRPRAARARRTSPQGWETYA